MFGKAKEAAKDRTIELSVDGMTCNHCVQSVTKALSELPDVKSVSVLLNSGATSVVTVVTDFEQDDEILTNAVTEAGFEVVGIERDLA